MENPISISNLNDFIFCPVSIYFHMLDADTEKMTYQSPSQINGTAAHNTVDSGHYSTKASVLQGISVYCEKYGLVGKIDVFDISSGILTERKRTIKTVYDGYVFQLYAQYFSLLEMGYQVQRLRLHSMTDNRNYEILLPNDNIEMLRKFESTIHAMRNFSFASFHQENQLKCENCIYEPLCSFSALEDYPL